MQEAGDESAALRARYLRARYRGTLGLDDVILWRSDPDAIGSTGERSPMARAADLKPLIYSRAITAQQELARDAAAAEAESLLAGWAADSAALDAALVERSQQLEAEHPHPSRPRVRRRVPALRVALIAGAAAIAVVVLVAVGMLLRPSPLAEEQAAPTRTAPTPAPTVASPSPTPTKPAVTRPPVVVITPPPEDLDTRPDYYEDDIVSVLQVTINGGPIDNANGVATVDDYGVPLSYVVASGDVFEVIAKRFDLGTTYLAGINAVRRENPTEVFVGDTINLGASTILRIGDQNGVVYDFADRLPDPHVPQD